MGPFSRGYRGYGDKVHGNLKSLTAAGTPEPDNCNRDQIQFEQEFELFQFTKL